MNFAHLLVLLFLLLKSVRTGRLTLESVTGSRVDLVYLNMSKVFTYGQGYRGFETLSLQSPALFDSITTLELRNFLWYPSHEFGELSLAAALDIFPKLKTLHLVPRYGACLAEQMSELEIAVLHIRSFYEKKAELGKYIQVFLVPEIVLHRRRQLEFRTDHEHLTKERAEYP